jgi:hypothetical protein
VAGHIFQARPVWIYTQSKACFPLGGILRAERNFSLSCDFSGGTN